jgi:hypothetical protein
MRCCREFRVAGCALFAMTLASSGMAQANEFTFSRGIGRFIAGNATQRSRTGSLLYSRSVTEQVAIEGGFDWFFLRGDGFSGFNIAGVYHFTPSSNTRQFIPFVSLGIGNTSTDLTEIPVHAVYRTRAGMKYYILPAVGFRVEFTERIIHTARDGYFQGAGDWAQLASIDFGLTLRH